MMKKILFEDALILSAAKTLRFFVHILPLSFSLWIARRIGDAVYCVTPRRKVALKNLRAAFAGEKTRSEMHRIARRSIQNLAMSGVELLRFPDMDKKFIDSHLKIIGTDKFKPVLDENRGAIFLTGHFGNWELLNATGGVLGYSTTALARTQKHPRSDEFLNSLRMSQGGAVVPKGMALREILRSLKKGGIVGMLSDQDGGRNGVFVPFFNRLSSTPRGVVTFALRTQSPVFPTFIFREGNSKHRVEVQDALKFPPTDTPSDQAEHDVLSQFSGILEAMIRRSPEQWLWAHRRWKSTPDRFVIVLSDGKTGHLNQSLAALEALKQARSEKGVLSEHFHSKIVEVKFKNGILKDLFRVVCFIFSGHIPFKSWWMKQVLAPECYELLMRSYADIVISCGSSVAGVNVLVSDENTAKSVVVMRPPFSSRHFHVVIAPEHDQMNGGENVFVTQGALSLITEENLEGQAAKLARELSLPETGYRIGLLAGGDADALKFAAGPFRKILNEIRGYAESTQSSILATSSRRTPGWADQILKETLSEKKLCPLLVIANEQNRSYVVAGILGLSDLVIVTGESISMVSEAVASGKPVLVVEPWENTKLKAKVQRFLDKMEKKQMIIRSSPENIVKHIQRYVGSADQSVRLGISKDKDVLTEAVKRVA